MITKREIFTLPYQLIGLIIGMLAIGVLKSLGNSYYQSEKKITKTIDKIEDYSLDVVFSALFYVILLIKIFI